MNRENDEKRKKEIAGGDYWGLVAGSVRPAAFVNPDIGGLTPRGKAVLAEAQERGDEAIVKALLEAAGEDNDDEEEE